jgi:predicted transcriptional regulator
MLNIKYLNLNMQNCYRNMYDIFESILNTANGNEVIQLEILNKANLSHGLFKKYMFPLLKSGLIEFIRHKRTYRTTEKGIQFINVCDKMKNLIQLHCDESKSVTSKLVQVRWKRVGLTQQIKTVYS